MPLKARANYNGSTCHSLLQIQKHEVKTDTRQTGCNHSSHGLSIVYTFTVLLNYTVFTSMKLYNNSVEHFGRFSKRPIKDFIFCCWNDPAATSAFCSLLIPGKYATLNVFMNRRVKPEVKCVITDLEVSDFHIQPFTMTLVHRQSSLINLPELRQTGDKLIKIS